MKIAKRFATVLRIIGWVTVAIAVGVTIYVLATSSGQWGILNGKLSALGVRQNIVDRLEFNHQFYSALIDAANTKTMEAQQARIQNNEITSVVYGDSQRTERLRPYFEKWEKRLEAAEQAEVQRTVDAFYQAENEALSQDASIASAYVEMISQAESNEESRLLKQAFEYLDGIAKPAAGKGKLAKLQAASVEPDVKAAYEALQQEHGEAVGDYLEYVESVVAMIKADNAGGATVTDVKGYVKNLDYDRYLAALSEVQAQEREQTDDIRDAYTQLMEQAAAGESVDVSGYYQSLYAAMMDRYPEETAPAMDVFVTNAKRLINDAKFDGSFSTLMKEVRAANIKAQESGTEAFMTSFAKGVVAVSDQNNDLGVFKLLWFLAANIIWVWVVGILLIVAAALIDRAVSKITLARLEHAGIEEDPDILLRVEHLKQYFRSGSYINKAVDNVSFYIKKGEVFGLVGESGCGKTTTGRTIINLYDPTEGDVYFQGLRISSTQNGLPVLMRSLKNEYKAAKTRMEADLKEQCAAHPDQANALTAAHKEKLAEMRQELRQHIHEAKTRALESSVEKSKCVEKYREKRKAELTAQYEEDMKGLSGQAAEDRKARYEIDMKVAAKDNIMTKMQMIFQDPIASINPRMTVREIIAEGLKIRGIKDEKYIDEKVYEVLDLVGLVQEHAGRYPHEFSGGQRQRIGIARAIVLQPDLIIADEPISALDVSIQAQVINLLNDLRNRMGLTIMFIAHNLSVVKYFSDRIGVMYYGHLVELATSDELFRHPLHPYTKSLLSAIPYPDPHHEKFRKRIEYDPRKTHDYSVDQPTLMEIRPGHFIRCNQAEFENYLKELED